MTQRFGVIGDPIAHSRSPKIHATFAAQFGLDFDYQRIHVTADALTASVEKFFAEGGQGLNVTLPHKQTVMALCEHLSDAALRAGSVNTLFQGENGISGLSTDGPGLVADLRRIGAPLTGARIALIGAGGAARGVVEPLLATQPQELVWSHRNPVKLEEPAAAFAGLGPLRPCANMALKGDRFDLILHATAAGHAGTTPLLPNGILAKEGWAYDLSYGPASEPFLEWSRGQGATHTHDGFGMLIEQAALSFAQWTKEVPDTAPVHKHFANLAG